jgi:acetyl-CoA acetyltransferase
MALAEGVVVPEGTTSNRPYSAMMDVYAAWARFHMRTFGTTRQQIAAVAAKNHAHSIHNPLSQYRTAYSVEDVLTAPPITYPLTLPMCAPISDGAAAAILVRESALSRFDRRRAVKVRASVLLTGTDRRPEEVEKHIGRRAALKAYGEAGVGPESMSVAEVHDATAMAEIMQIENLGFCSFSEGGPTSARGETSLGGVASRSILREASNRRGTRSVRRASGTFRADAAAAWRGRGETGRRGALRDRRERRRGLRDRRGRLLRHDPRRLTRRPVLRRRVVPVPLFERKPCSTMS